MPKQGSIEVGPPAAKGETRIRRCYLSPDQLVTGPKSAPDCKVVADILPHVVKLYGKQDGLGSRELIRMVEEEKEVTKVVGGKEVKEMKKWSFYEMTDYKYQTYAEFYETVKMAGSALVATNHSKETIFNIYSATSARWQVMANACASQSVTFATAYDSLGEEGLQHSISEPNVYGLFTNANLLGTVAKVVSKTPTLKVVVWDGKLEDVAKGALDTIKSAHEGIQVYTYEEFLHLGREKPVEANKPDKDDICCIMYTSGSTGAPKGVMISNANVIAAIGAVEVILPDVIKAGESYIAYLPLAHVMEFTVELCLMFVGARIGYANIKTLTDASVRNCVGDIKAFQPTLMVGVPAVWELIRKGVAGKVKAGGPVKSAVFNAAMSAKKFGGRGSMLANVTDAIVFSAVAQGTGGKLKYVLNGGASISKETAEYLSTALVPVLAGFGLTESTAMCCLLPPAFHQFGPVGIPVPSAEIKLVDFEEAGYFATNSPPQGEIYIRGPSITKGYFNRPEVTQESYTEDGWFKTGDIGQWNKDGTLSIIDRKKNLVKMSGGEYIALERLESIYRSCPYVANICLYADPQANRAMAIVQPHEVNLKAMVADKNLAPDAHGDLATIVKNDKVKAAVLADLNATGKKAGLKPLESLQSVILSDVEFLPTNGLVTAAQKLNRKYIGEYFKSQIDAVYP